MADDNLERVWARAVADYLVHHGVDTDVAKFLSDGTPVPALTEIKP
jgi:hypothetical protein